MPKVTILGAGITALAAASMLPRNYDVTVVARDLPGDSDTRGWSSPNAGAIFMGMAKCSEHDQKLQMDSFWVWWRQALQNPESSVRRIEMQDLIDGASLESVWYAGKFPEFRVMSADEMPKDADFGMSYQSIIITPSVYLVWLRRQLEASGVKFIRAHVKSLSELRGMGHDVLVNATGTGAAHLRDVADPLMEEVRGQTILVKSPFDKIWARRGKDYTYAFGRPDGTTILGGIKQYGNTDTSVYETDRTDICQRIHHNLPKDFPSPDPKDLDIVRDIVGIRPQRRGGARIETEIADGQMIVHAYGAEGGGYIFSWGIAREVSEIIAEHFTYKNSGSTEATARSKL